MKTNTSIQNHHTISTSRHLEMNSLLQQWWITKQQNINTKHKQDENKTD